MQKNPCGSYFAPGRITEFKLGCWLFCSVTRQHPLENQAEEGALRKIIRTTEITRGQYEVPQVCRSSSKSDLINR
jgi:hypothetical protein